MVDVRKQAKALLDKVPDEVRSDGDRKLFSDLTNGMTHETLQGLWEATKSSLTELRTVCIDFIVWYSQNMKIDILSTIDPKKRDKDHDGFFALKETLEKCGKAHAWVPATSGRPPLCGDILRHTRFHVDVSTGLENRVLVRVAGGQSRHDRPTQDVTKEYDNVKRVRGNGIYNSKDLQGWLDLDQFFQPPPVPTPAWVIGWWKVQWRNQFYYYYLASDGSARWTKIPPLPVTPPPLPPWSDNAGHFIFINPYGVMIRWFDTESLEVFSRDPASDSTDMTGKWNETEPIEASKL